MAGKDIREHEGQLTTTLVKLRTALATEVAPEHLDRAAEVCAILLP